METVSVEVVRSLLGSAPIIDVVPEEAYRQAHIPGSRCVPLGRGDFVQQIEALARDKRRPIVVYAAEPGEGAAKAARRLERAGYERVLDFEGGLAEWERAGLAVEGGSPLTPPAGDSDAETDWPSS